MRKFKLFRHQPQAQSYQKRNKSRGALATPSKTLSQLHEWNEDLQTKSPEKVLNITEEWNIIKDQSRKQVEELVETKIMEKDQIFNNLEKENDKILELPEKKWEIKEKANNYGYKEHMKYK
jgi:hypothetical protein